MNNQKTRKLFLCEKSVGGWQGAYFKKTSVISPITFGRGPVKEFPLKSSVAPILRGDGMVPSS